MSHLEFPTEPRTREKSCGHTGWGGVRDKEALWALGGLGEAAHCVSESPISKRESAILHSFMGMLKEQVFDVC